MARKGWTGLSATYRARLEKAGISRSDYESGQSIQGARGHAQTPENPRRYDTTKYSTYDQSRKALIGKIETRKDELWSGRPRWNKEKSDSNLRRDPPSMALMRRVLAMTDEELFDAFIETPELYKWFGYH